MTLNLIICEGETARDPPNTSSSHNHSNTTYATYQTFGCPSPRKLVQSEKIYEKVSTPSCSTVSPKGKFGFGGPVGWSPSTTVPVVSAYAGSVTESVGGGSCGTVGSPTIGSEGGTTTTISPTIKPLNQENKNKKTELSPGGSGKKNGRKGNGKRGKDQTKSPSAASKINEKWQYSLNSKHVEETNQESWDPMDV